MRRFFKSTRTRVCAAAVGRNVLEIASIKLLVLSSSAEYDPRDFLNLRDFVSGTSSFTKHLVVECAMSNTEADLLHLSCPNCAHDGVRLQVASATVVTVRCAACQHTWSVDSTTLPSDVREQISEATAINHG